ncbi:response regulator transcription factor [Variovorax saccharolyticus]|uniref:response regulator transcription factor n=1 Tax=Variovorax saccharolyticus TaxID=3053516 RepID=UPI002576E7A2|nr:MULTISPECIES: response regulator [unclassified Variovorax]MDM0022882.1 response regulator [Variovorax sp. J22R187]MDM0029670.1 response regulator [Variovorax sp. J31P216]
MVKSAADLDVYVVDDDASVRSGLARLMRSAGHRALTFDCGEAFLTQAAQGAVGCVVLDISMPGMNGLQVRERLMRAAVALPVIALSARDDDETRRLARALGVRFFLRKPVDDQALLDAIDWVTGSGEVAPSPAPPR